MVFSVQLPEMNFTSKIIIALVILSDGVSMINYALDLNDYTQFVIM